MEPLRLGDPERLGEWLITGRLWASGNVVAFQAMRGHERTIMLGANLQQPPPNSGLNPHEWLNAWRDTNAWAQANIIEADVEGMLAWVAYTEPPGLSVRARITSGVPLTMAEAHTATGHVTSALMASPDVRPILITPDTTFITDGALQIVGSGFQDFLTNVAGPSASLGVDALQWLAPEEFTTIGWNARSPLFSIAAVLVFGESGRAPWTEPVTSLLKLTQRSVAPWAADLDGTYEGLLSSDPDQRPVLEAAEPTEPIAAEFEDPLVEDTQDVTSHITASSSRSRGPSPLVIVGLISAVAVVLSAGTIIWRTSTEPDPPSAKQTSSTSPSPTQSGGSTTTTTTREEADTATDNSAKSQLVQYEVRLTYENSAVPATAPQDGTEWIVDVCSPDTSLTQAGSRKKITVQRKKTSDGRWENLSGTANVKRAGRCPSNQVNITFTYEEPVPPLLPRGSTWSPCFEYRLNLPETKRFKKATLPFCVFLRTV